MGDEIVSEFMRERRAKMKTEEKTLKEFIKELQNFRKAMAALNGTGVAVLDVFARPSRSLPTGSAYRRSRSASPSTATRRAFNRSRNLMKKPRPATRKRTTTPFRP